MTGCGAVLPVPDLVARFSEALARLNPDGGRIGLAVSGGADSLALLLLAQAAIPGQFAVATVNHGLRAAAADECALVAAVCAARAIPCAVLAITVPPGNVQAEARHARYTALADWAEREGLAAVATAHHADDQAETLLMRLNRGSGLAGLAGVREVAMIGPLRVIRPLLGERRAGLAQVVAGAGLVPVADPSNSDSDYDRVRIRQALVQAEWLDPAALARSSRNLAEALEAVQHYAAQEWDQRVRADGAGYALQPHPMRGVNRRLVAEIMQALGGRPRGGDVARLLARLEAGGQGNVAGVLGRVHNSEWVFAPEPPRRTPC